MLGILLIDKEEGCTSHDVVNRVRRLFRTKRVGHAGTLDPAATGLLVVAVGPATRFLQYLPLEPKEYVAEVTFGIETDTFDREGQVIAKKDPPNNLEAAIHMTLPKFKGLIRQLPPMYSAVKVGGQPLYKYARQGKELEREPRTVHIETFEILGMEGAVVSARIVCSGGTYVRTLAHDLGQEIGCGAYLSKLVRTRVGRFNLEHAVRLEEATEDRLIPLREALPPMPLVSLNELQTHYIREGRQVRLQNLPKEQFVALVEPEGEVFSVARIEGNQLQPECVIPAEVR